MKSIRFELTLIITLIVIITTMGIVISSVLFLDDFYVFRKINMLNQTMEEIDNTYNGEYSSIQSIIEREEKIFGLKFYTNNNKTNSDLGIKYEHTLSDATSITTYLYKSNITKTMGTVIPFIIITGSIFSLFSIFFGIFFTKRITKPILEIKKVAEKITNLNFKEKFTGKQKNELGSLGNSINYLSLQLEEKINMLENDNQKLYKDITTKEKTEVLRNKLISDISHELRTPITAIKGYSEYLRNINDKTRQEKYIKIIYDESEKLSKLIDSILDISKIQNNQMIFEMETLDISKEVDSIISIYWEKISRNNINITIDVDNILIEYDKTKLSQIIRNYVNNAFYFVDENKIIKIYTKIVNSKTYLCVYNSGNNIDEIYKEVIWDSFFKVDKARTGGNGIGLAIIKGIMKNSNLDFGFTNLENGVAFYIELKTI